MMRFFKILMTFIIIIVINCTFDFEPEPPFITEKQWQLIKAIALENNYPESSDLDGFVQYLYEEWPDDDKIRDFILTFPVQDTTVPRTLVLSDILTQIGKTLRVAYHDPRTGNVYPARIDSTEIRTDSVIIIPSINLSDCNLKHLPPQIGKIRTGAPDISYNYKTLQSIPDELMQLSSPPFYWDTLKVKYDYGAVNAMNPDIVSDTLKNWLKEHYVSF